VWNGLAKAIQLLRAPTRASYRQLQGTDGDDLQSHWDASEYLSHNKQQEISIETMETKDPVDISGMRRSGMDKYALDCNANNDLVCYKYSNLSSCVEQFKP
jgi:hypothetical protein